MTLLSKEQQDQLERMAKGEIKPTQFVITKQLNDDLPETIARVVFFDGLVITKIKPEVGIDEVKEVISALQNLVGVSEGETR